MSDTAYADWREVVAAIASLQSFAIITHVRPDGDAYGSLIAFGLALEGQDKRVALYCEDGMIDRYRFLPGAEKVQCPPKETPAVDALIALDCAAEKRLGAASQGWDIRAWLNIDHHESNERFGRINIVDPHRPATGELLFELFKMAGWPVTPDIADNLFVAISTDTGSFRYRNTTPRTFEIAGELSRLGARIGDLSLACYGSFPMRRTKLLKEILQDLSLDCRDTLAYYRITQDMYRRTGARPEDTEGIIENIISTEGVELAVVFEERKNGTVKMSFRSKGAVNVNAIARQFGGGGHPQAAGAELHGAIAEVQGKVLPVARAALAPVAAASKVD